MSLEVRPGEAVTAEKWNQMQRAAAATQILRGGENTRIHILPHGTLLNSKHGGGWNHPWRVASSRLSARVYPGTINGEYPVIVDNYGNTAKLNAQPPPYLYLGSPKVGPNNVGWIALQLQMKEDYRTIEWARVVQVDYIVGSELMTTNPFFFYGLPGIGHFQVRYPLARLQYFPDSGNVTIFQVAMFNLNHTAKPPPQVTRPGEIAQSALPRHFFWPA